jgi:hypothetical protein
MRQMTLGTRLLGCRLLAEAVATSIGVTRRYLLTLLAVLLPVTTFAQTASPDLPANLQPFTPLVEQCAAYEALIRHWKPVFAAGFARTSAPTWAAVIKDPQTVLKGKGSFTAFDKEINREVLSIDEHEEWEGGGVAMMGPSVAGDYAVEVVAQGVSGFSNSEGNDLKAITDLSLIVGDIERDAGFQFGAHWNSQNFLWVGSTTGADGHRTHVRVDLPMPPKIEKRRWYRVRLALKNGVLAGYVDGKLLGRGKMVREYDLKSPRRAAFHTWTSLVYIDQFKIEKAAANPMDPKPAWTQIFGNAQPQEIQKRLTALAHHLLDDQEAPRLAAETLLRRAGSLAVVPLQEVAKSAPAEKSRLPRDLAEVLSPPPPAPE